MAHGRTPWPICFKNCSQNVWYTGRGLSRHPQWCLLQHVKCPKAGQVIKCASMIKWILCLWLRGKWSLATRAVVFLEELHSHPSNFYKHKITWTQGTRNVTQKGETLIIWTIFKWKTIYQMTLVRVKSQETKLNPWIHFSVFIYSLITLWKIFAIHISNKGLESRIYTELL